MASAAQIADFQPTQFRRNTMANRKPRQRTIRNQEIKDLLHKAIVDGRTTLLKDKAAHADFLEEVIWTLLDTDLRITGGEEEGLDTLKLRLGLVYMDDSLHGNEDLAMQGEATYEAEGFPVGTQGFRLRIQQQISQISRLKDQLGASLLPHFPPSKMASLKDQLG
jgi:hypothetical protein